MSKMMHDQPSAAVPASRDRRNFLIAGAGLALAATTLGRSGAVMAKPAGQDTPNAPSDAAPVRKETLTTRKLGSLEVSSMGLGCLPMVGYYGGGPRDRKAMVSLIRAAFEQGIQRFDSTDRRHNLPRFQPDALAKNMVLLEFAQSWARRKNTTPVQFALAWVMAQRPWIVPIPGTTQYPHLIENSGAPQVRLTDSELREIDAALAKIPLQGGRADPFTESQFDKS
ncbi:TPA: aldo/keto reductase [Klebsiella pneumoniae]